MSAYQTFLSWNLQKASGYIFKKLKMSADWSGALIHVCAVTAKMLRWFRLGNLRESEHGDVLPTTAYYVMFM